MSGHFSSVKDHDSVITPCSKYQWSLEGCCLGSKVLLEVGKVSTTRQLSKCLDQGVVTGWIDAGNCCMDCLNYNYNFVPENKLICSFQISGNVFLWESVKESRFSLRKWKKQRGWFWIWRLQWGTWTFSSVRDIQKRGIGLDRNLRTSRAQWLRAQPLGPDFLGLKSLSHCLLDVWPW